MGEHRGYGSAAYPGCSSLSLIRRSNNISSQGATTFRPVRGGCASTFLPGSTGDGKEDHRGYGTQRMRINISSRVRSGWGDRRDYCSRRPWQVEERKSFPITTELN